MIMYIRHHSFFQGKVIIIYGYQIFINKEVGNPNKIKEG